MTADDIQRVARELVRPDQLSIVLVGNAAAFASRLRSAGFGTFDLIKLDELDLLAPDFKHGSETPGVASQGVPPRADLSPGPGGPTAIGPARTGRVAYAATSAVSPRAVQNDEAGALLDRVIAAKGGLAALEAVRGLRAVARAPVTGPRGETAQVESTTDIRYPNQVRIESRLPSATIIQVSDGRHAWVKDPGGVHDVPDEALAGIEAGIARDAIPLLLAARGGALRVRQLSDARDEAGHPQHVLEFTGERLGEQQPLILYIDAGTDLVDRQTYPGGPGEPLIQEAFSDYRAVGGVQIPFATRVTRDGELLAERTITDVTINPPADPARFSRPES